MKYYGYSLLLMISFLGQQNFSSERTFEEGYIKLTEEAEHRFSNYLRERSYYLIPRAAICGSDVIYNSYVGNNYLVETDEVYRRCDDYIRQQNHENKEIEECKDLSTALEKSSTHLAYPKK